MTIIHLPNGGNILRTMEPQAGLLPPAVPYSTSPPSKPFRPPLEGDLQLPVRILRNWSGDL